MSMNDLKGSRILILNVPDNLTPAIESATPTMKDAGLTVVRLGEAMEAFRHIKNERLATGLREALIVHKSAAVGIGREFAMAAMMPPLPRLIDPINELHDDEERAFRERQRVLVIEPRTTMSIEAILNDVAAVKIDKTKDRFSFADHFVGRGKRRNR